MTQRRWLFGLMFLGVYLGFAQTAEAQRSGFIIGLGVGPGVASYTTLVSGTGPFAASTDSAVSFGLGSGRPRYVA